MARQTNRRIRPGDELEGEPEVAGRFIGKLRKNLDDARAVPSTSRKTPPPITTFGAISAQQIAVGGAL